MSAQFDSRAFRRALGNFATGVTVITAQDAEGNKAGMTANSFTSVSLDPALVLWCIDKNAKSYDIFQHATHFAINILAADQIDLSNNFARHREDKFEGIAHHEGLGKVLLLDDAAAHFECELFKTVDAGDHYILIGKVLSFNDDGRAPLLYHQGTYSAVLPHPSLHKKREDVLPEDNPVLNGKLFSNMHYLLTQAVRTYQNDYYPKQLASGLRSSEARMLLVLAGEHANTKVGMLKEVAMPMREIDQAVEILKRKCLLVEEGETLLLTDKGREKAMDLFDIADEHQAQVFGRYKAEEVELFKRMLTDMIVQ
ncbi:p-hydroxyphenylacetate 3-hydroxylase reductase component [Wohlfahrtiimonas chitiniclastica]|uniref:p-hydroxyphenylacetate 3-hydroxylase reductase component n=1 Tax=Wohlfahrtiimonas chitiniclastica TaxID=400946 RepID=UPI001BCE46C7|nr:flavin reductase family protein [Wohlfahrtiimonas chitiniclastica]MBS7838421.1 flavin reductase family protein [Wohlfahrtiimonas chitiniclastica]